MTFRFATLGTVRCELYERAHRRDEDRVAAARRRVQSEVGDARAHGFRLVLENVLRGGIGVRLARAREEPAQIGMDELRGVAAVHALAAWALAFAGAEQELSEPERETLLADAAASLDEETRGERGARCAVCQSAAKRVMAE